MSLVGRTNRLIRLDEWGRETCRVNRGDSRVRCWDALCDCVAFVVGLQKFWAWLCAGFTSAWGREPAAGACVPDPGTNRVGAETGVLFGFTEFACEGVDRVTGMVVKQE